MLSDSYLTVVSLESTPFTEDTRRSRPRAGPQAPGHLTPVRTYVFGLLPPFLLLLLELSTYFLQAQDT